MVMLTDRIPATVHTHLEGLADSRKANYHSCSAQAPHTLSVASLEL